MRNADICDDTRDVSKVPEAMLLFFFLSPSSCWPTVLYETPNQSLLQLNYFSCSVWPTLAHARGVSWGSLEHKKQSQEKYDLEISRNLNKRHFIVYKYAFCQIAQREDLLSKSCRTVSERTTLVCRCKFMIAFPKQMWEQLDYYYYRWGKKPGWVRCQGIPWFRSPWPFCTEESPICSWASPTRDRREIPHISSSSGHTHSDLTRPQDSFGCTSSLLGKSFVLPRRVVTSTTLHKFSSKHQ